MLGRRLLASCLAFPALLAPSTAYCQAGGGANPQVITVEPVAGPVYPNFYGQLAILVVHFDGVKSETTAEFLADLTLPVNNDWDCADPKNYKVTRKSKDAKKTTEYPVTIVHVDTTSKGSSSCAQFKGIGYPIGTYTIRLQLDDQIVFGVEYDVEVLNLKDGSGNLLKISSTGGPGADKAVSSFSPNANPKTLSVTAQSILDEPLTNGEYKGVEQLAMTGNIPFARGLGKGSAIYVNTADVISTNERDKKSAFLGGLGWEWGPQGWYFPIKLEGDAQGNQVATNLSSVVSLSADTILPWGGTSSILDNKLFQVPLSPDFTIALPYTHRFNQVVSSTGKPLAVEDFSVNPALALRNGVLFPNPTCDPNTATAKRLLCFGFEADMGLYYLPLDTTSKGNQRAEGYGDFSFLIPLSDFSHFPFITVDTQTLASQIRVEYSDDVTPANNYLRTKKWSFGVEVIGAKK